MTKRSVTKKPKLTKWFDGSKFVPYHVGEYNASPHAFGFIFRWWDGARWSYPYFQDSSEDAKKNSRSLKENPILPIHFRGLAQKPEVKP